MLFFDRIRLGLESVFIGSRANITRPVGRIDANLVRPAPERVVAVARHVLARLLVQREGKVLSVVDDHFEALIVDDRPETLIAVEVCR